MSYSSTFTPEEHYKLNGSLTPEQLDELFDAADRLSELGGIETYIDEAQGQYPEEDFLADDIADLQAIAKNMRGTNRQLLLDAIEALEQKALDVGRSAEYGREELAKAAALLVE